MPSEYRIFPEDGLVVLRLNGQITMAGVREMFESYLRDPIANPQDDFLVDLSAVTEFDIDFQAMLAYVSQSEQNAPARAPGTKTAMLAASDVAFGISRMYQSLAEGRLDHEIGVFRTRSEAMTFLGRVDPDDTSPPRPLP